MKRRGFISGVVAVAAAFGIFTASAVAIHDPDSPGLSDADPAVEVCIGAAGCSVGWIVQERKGVGFVANVVTGFETPGTRRGVPVPVNTACVVDIFEASFFVSYENHETIRVTEEELCPA